MATTRILLVDDDPPLLEMCRYALEQVPDTTVATEADGREAAARLSRERFDLLITDNVLPGITGPELVGIARSLDPELAILVVTGHPSVETAIEALKRGAADYMTKPLDLDGLVRAARRLVDGRRLLRENALLARHLERPFVSGEIVGSGPAATALLRTIQKISAADVDVLVTGETGVGKEMVARSIHRASRRGGSRFVPVDCGAIPEKLIESELFGYERGAFSGAVDTSMGLFEFADGGTVFLDEIGELAPALQAKLLRTLQERKIRRLGGREEIGIDVRVVSATSRDLDRMQREGRFRGDLYHRINVARVHVPPLRARSEDVPALLEHFIGRTARELRLADATLDPEVGEVLARYSWPGNVRELANVVRSMLALAERSRLTADDIPDHLLGQPSGASPSGPGGAGAGAGTGFFELRARELAEFERDYLTGLISDHRGDVTRAAERARMPRGTLYRLLKKYDLAPDEYRA